MFKVGDAVRVRRYEEIPEHPVYRRTKDSVEKSCYFGIDAQELSSLADMGRMTVIGVKQNRYQVWYGADSDCVYQLDKDMEPVYVLDETRDADFNYEFLGNMLEPYDGADENMDETPDAEEFFASLF